MSPKSRPQYRQIADTLRAEIKDGVHERGEALPTERVLAQRFGVSTEVVNRAVRVLRAEGLVRSVHGRGAFVSRIPPIRRGAAGRYTQAAREANGGRGAFATEIRAMGFEPRSDLVQVGRTTDAPQEVLDHLGLPEGSEVVIRDRRMYADDVPVQIATSYLTVEVAGGTVIEERDTGVGGTYSRLAELGHRVARFAESVRTRPASEEEASFLDLDDEQHLYDVLHLAVSEDARVVEVTIHLMPIHQWILDYEWSADE